MTVFRILALTAMLVLAVALLCAPTYLAQVQAQSQAAVPEIHLTFTTIDVPGAKYTVGWGINSAGETVGNYGQDTGNDSHGFLYNNGTFTYFDYPGQAETVPTGINDNGLIVGYAGDLSVVGFLYDGTSFTNIRHGNDSATFALGINNADYVVGGFGTVGATRGFELRGSHYKTLSPPPGGWIYVYANGINTFGQVVGWYTGATVNGFAYKNGKYQIIAFPGSATTTKAEGVNDNGIIVGWYDGCSRSHPACAFAFLNGKYVSFHYPGALGTFADGVNASGQVVGAYQLADGSYHGFTTSPITAADFEQPGCCKGAAESDH
ncbi:MAG: DUF3466 family protein [Acidobacteriia bacterium]|nr:DUF3466 family protein [Terriglobia bacterium]